MSWTAIDYVQATQVDEVAIGGDEYYREVIPLAFSVTNTAINRETVRDDFETLLEAALVGTGLPCQATYNYKIHDFAGRSPVAVVASAGSDRGRLTFDGGFPRIFINVYVFVLYASSSRTWDEAAALDALDDIEKRIAGVIDANQYKA